MVDFQTTMFLVLDDSTETIKVITGYPSQSESAAWMLEGPMNTQDETIVICNCILANYGWCVINHQLRGVLRVPGDVTVSRWMIEATL